MKKYIKVKKISQGAFGTVYQYKNTEPSAQIPQRVAIKEMFGSSNNVKRELGILRTLPQHKNILKIYEIIEQSFYIQIVMELGKYDLLSFMELISYPIPQIQVKKVAYQLFNALKTLHGLQYIHRDLKPSNIIVNQKGLIQLCDFGSAIKCSKGEEYELEGFTKWYKSPEMLYGSRNYKFQVDIWGVGCILMEFATGQPYFDGKSQIQQLSLITKQLGNPNKQNWPSFSKLPDYGKINFKPMNEKSVEQISTERGISLELAKFIRQMVKYDNRKSAAQLLKHPFLSDISELNESLSMPLIEQQTLATLTKTSFDKLKKEINLTIKNC